LRCRWRCSLQVSPEACILQTTVAPTPAAAGVYHFGRLIGYASLGALAGHLGDSVFSKTSSESLAWLSAISFATILVVIAIKMFKRNSTFHFALQTKFSVWIFRNVMSLVNRPIRSLVLGILTPLLPCGWLLSFLLGATLTQDAAHGSLFMASFWLGTLPALGILPFVRSKMSKWFGLKTNQFASGLLLFTAFALIAVRLIASYQRVSCH
jgi:uncharacterized protein